MKTNMKRILCYSLLFLVTGNGLAMAQHIQGRVIDGEYLPVDGVAVVLQTLDSVYVDATVTDSLGQFLLNQPSDKTYRLLYQHLLYEAFQKDVSTADAGIIQLKSKDYRLGEVTVKAERPQVKVEGGKLTYDIPQLMKNKTHTNAFEVVKELPGVTGSDESVELLGAGSLHIILNGQITTMSLEQLIQLLKSMPASRVQKAEIMYNAPAKYNIKGALINVILDKPLSDKPTLQGEAGLDYQQYHYAFGGAHANLVYSTSRLNIDLLVNGDKGRMYYGEDMLARHTLNKEITEIEQVGRSTAAMQEGAVRLGMDYTFLNKDKLSGSYYLNADQKNTIRNARTAFSSLEKQTSSVSQSVGYVSDHSTLHNVRMQYDGHAGLTAGMDFTHYQSPSRLHFLDNSDTGTQTEMFNNTQQDVSRWSLFMNQTHTFTTGWTLNYGVQGGYAYSKNNSDTESERNKQKEYNGNIFAETSKSFGERFSASIALKAEYFKSDYLLNGEKSNLWNDWTLFPTASLSYTFTPQHILQLNVSSDKTYPSYWNVSPQMNPLNSYSVVVGNPLLKPYRSYTGQLLYIFRQKYMLMAFCNYEPDYFIQLPYQSDTELKNVFRYENLDYNWQTGLALIVPFKVGTFWDSRITLNGMRQQEKSSHFYSMTFNREAYVGVLFMNNTFNLSSHPNLKLSVDGNYQTAGAIQGVYELGSAYRVSAALKWTFASEQASLTLRGEDLFHSAYPNSIQINQGTQWSRMHKLNDINHVKLSFVWKFGNYKAPKHDAVDRSRLGR